MRRPSRPLRLALLLSPVFVLATVTLLLTGLDSAEPSTAAEARPDECTSVIAGRLATTDGSTITSHTCDGTSRNWVEIVPGGAHEPDEMVPVWNKRIKKTEFVGDMRTLGTRNSIRLKYPGDQNP